VIARTVPSVLTFVVGRRDSSADFTPPCRR
jgi:hypothetical protein